MYEQQKSEEALAIKREGDSLVDFCGYLLASVACDGMFIGNAEIVPFSPRKYLYHAYLAYMRANGLNKPVSLMRFGTDMPVQWLSMARRIRRERLSTVLGQTLRYTAIQTTGCHPVQAPLKIAG